MSDMTGARPAGLFGNRFFQTVLMSNIMLQIGIWVRNFAILLYVADMTDSDPYAIAFIYVAEFLPIFLFSFIGGTFADRWRPKRTMIWSDFLSALSVFAVMATMVMGVWQMVFFATLVSSILSQFSQPSAMRMFKIHLRPDQLQQAMAFFQSMVAIFMVGGPSLGTFMYDRYGIEISIAVTGVAFLLSALVLLRLPETPSGREAGNPAGAGAVDPAGAPPQQASFRRELAEGFQYVWRSPVLRVLGLTFALAGIGVGMVQPLGIFVVTEKLGQEKEFLQYLLMVNGAAMLLGGGLIAALARRVLPQKLLAFGMFAGAVTTLGIGLSEHVWLTLVLQFIAGLTFPSIHIGISTMILRWSDASIVGRVNGVLNPMFMGMMVVMIACGGSLKAWFPLEALYAASALAMTVGTAALATIFRHRPPEEAAAPAVSGAPSH
ncbi:MAG: MFS transporter [Thermobacillus sp. ZCTH02-B1]|uniref:MFS transporter n=1 Tax=Thermobacillus sp. ZCTH02-B1 TaxID=1858795 RepID=UPI000B5548A1|nr:MFS transporter [Thermobacillus sp. ZCTH02-B1]OUM94856.1 MAG: MFS transporter [Thermobacillus sp. ZCTH02-B1]